MLSLNSAKCFPIPCVISWFSHHTLAIISRVCRQTISEAVCGKSLMSVFHMQAGARSINDPQLCHFFTHQKQHPALFSVLITALPFHFWKKPWAYLLTHSLLIYDECLEEQSTHPKSLISISTFSIRDEILQHLPQESVWVIVYFCMHVAPPPLWLPPGCWCNRVVTNSVSLLFDCHPTSAEGRLEALLLCSTTSTSGNSSKKASVSHLLI